MSARDVHRHRRSSPAALLVGALVVTAAPSWSPAADPDDPNTSGFTVRYNATRTPAHARLRDTLERARALEQVASELNDMVRLPRSIQIRAGECGIGNAFWDARTQRITLCYEMIDQLRDAFRARITDQAELDKAVIGATLFTLYHEVAHGLIHVLDLPAVGREEDSADQLATLTLIQMGDRGIEMALAGAEWFELQAGHDARITPSWDEHALDAQRRFNVLCLVYGSDTEKHGWLVSRRVLPPERATRCKDEFAKINRAWEKLLDPHQVIAGAR